MRPRYIDFEVMGRTQFPSDMLRYDECWPVSTDDAFEMAHSMAADGPKKTVTIKLRTANDRGPTTARWSSFLWGAKIVEPD